MNILKLYQDYNIPVWTEGNNVSPGWINTQCCWCDDPSNHLGFDPSDEHFNCWRCGGHLIVPTIAKLLHTSDREAKGIIKQYGGKVTVVQVTKTLPTQG